MSSLAPSFLILIISPGSDHLGHLGNGPSFRSSQSQIHRFPDSPGLDDNWRPAAESSNW
jgi:hypothetical protein